MNRQEFIKVYGPAAIVASLNSKIFPSVVMAQAILESRNGSSLLSANFNNFFGLKAGSSWEGETADLATGEYISGEWTTVNAPFRAYRVPQDSFTDLIKLYNKLTRYNEVLTAKTPQAQARAIQLGGYATDPNYANKLIRIIETENLTELDKKKSK